MEKLERPASSEWIWVAATEVDSSVENEWNEWYDNVHLPHILERPGWLTGSRYLNQAADIRHYLAIYELAGPEAPEAPQAAAQKGWGKFEGHVRATAPSRLYKRRIFVKKHGAAEE